MEFIKEFFKTPPIISAFSSRKKGLIYKPFRGVFKRQNGSESRFLET
jgi:hypothetical protein